MHFPPKLSAIAFAVCASAFATSAIADSMEITVGGTIAPPSCTPSIVGGGEIDYGMIDVNTLEAAAFTQLDAKQVDFKLSCNMPIRAAVKLVDSRNTSVLPGAAAAAVTGATDDHGFGLGTSGSTKIGAYVISLKSGTFTADGSTVHNITGTNKTSWSASSTPVKTGSNYYSWSASAGGMPTSFKDLEGKLEVQAALNHADNLPQSDDIELNGLATVEVEYL